MGREIRRVALDFTWPVGEVWEGFLLPERLHEEPCPDCKHGYSPHAEHLFDLWYGNQPFDPATTGSTPLRHDTPAVRARAERNVANAPEFYGAGEWAIVREAQRLADLFNGQWCHHLTQDDVDALVAANRLWDFTSAWDRETGWQKIDPPVTPTAGQVNEWSLHGFGHDSLNAGIVVSARCQREGVPDRCSRCNGHASLEKYPGQRAEAEAWEATEPPAGDGWQLWETVTDGSPVSPVFATAEEHAAWMSHPDRGRHWVPPETAAKFIADGWAPTLVGTPETGVVSGVEFVGFHVEVDAEPTP
jgi:hypothetical protein